MRVAPAGDHGRDASTSASFTSRPTARRDILLDLLDAAQRQPRHRLHPHQARRRPSWPSTSTSAGIDAAAIHGDKSQGQRERALASFKAGKVRALVATDIAARGIDVDAVSHVFNYELPNVPEAYVHRIGRTARAGAEGIAITLCDRAERGLLRDIEKLTRLTLPSEDLRIDRSTPTTRAEPQAKKSRRGRGGGGRTGAPNAGMSNGGTQGGGQNGRRRVRPTIPLAPRRGQTTRGRTALEAPREAADGRTAAAARQGPPHNPRKKNPA